MVSRAPDALELLLPDAAPAVWQRAQQVTTFLRLLSNDARQPAGASVAVNLDRARGELEREARARAASAIEDLVRLHLYALVGPDSFAWYGEPASGHAALWSALEEQREEWLWLASVPAPGEPALTVARRLLDSLERLECGAARLALWRARLVRAEHGPQAGEEALRELCSAETRADEGARAGALAGVIECLLDRGAVRPARALLDEHTPRTLSDARLRRLLVWVRLLQGDVAGARAVHAGLSAWRGRLPSALLELREDQPDWLALLSGRSWPTACAIAEPSSPLDLSHPARAEFGAALVGAFALAEGGATTALFLDVSPGLRSRVAGWTEERDGACSHPHEHEHHLIVSARTRVVHRGEAAIRGAIDPQSIRSLALEPVLDERGEVRGWLRVECEHHLVPARARLASLARRLRPRVLAAREAAIELQRGAAQSAAAIAVAPIGTAPAIATGVAPIVADDAPQAALFRELVERLAMKTGQRHWWGFDVSGAAPELVAHGGQALTDASARAGGARAIERALLSGGLVQFDEPDAGLSIHRDAGSGLVLPLRTRGRVAGLWAVESVRRRDFANVDAARVARCAEELAPLLCVAQFRAWHRARFGFDVHFQGAGPGAALRAEDVVAAGRARSAIAVCGPAGSGKRVVARWLHYESDRRPGPFELFSCGTSTAAEAASALWGSSRERDASSHDAHGGLFARSARGSVVLVDVERLDASLQSRLAAWLEARESDRIHGTPMSPRVLVTSRAPIAESVASGLLRADLGERLGRLELHVPALDHRREELPALLEILVQRFARQENLRPPSFPDETVALFWRQPWKGNLRELQSLIYKLVLLAPGAPIRPEQLEAIAARFRTVLLRRLPSRHPDPETLRAALRTTATQRGTFNKTRAALYLGWDPDTLVSRLQELGWSEAAVWEPLPPEAASGSASGTATVGGSGESEVAEPPETGGGEAR